MKQAFWSGKRVFLTGHTGFKGSWLALWLQDMGAEVHGYALQPPTDPNLYSIANVMAGMTSSTIADIRDLNVLSCAIQAANPEIIFHMAAQPLVRYSYQAPLETYATNVMGTVNLFEAVRAVTGVKAVINVTTDKCYENREWMQGYREDEPLGGHDPYSSSKACAELVTAAYRCSFFEATGVSLASVRAGNVLGGGDWAEDRLVPDFLRASDRGELLQVRSPGAIRPWQHVLDPLSGYMRLAEKLYVEGVEFAEAWNFGPSDSDAKPVCWIVERLAAATPGAKWQCDEARHPHEAHYLKLDSSKAMSRLGWKPRWQLEEALAKVLEWHAAWRHGEDMRGYSLAQIHRHETEGTETA